MCLLISQKTSTPIEKTLLENADCSNPDGIGYAYADGGKIQVKKYREFEEFYKAYSKDVKQFGKMSNFILHFRYSTHGVNTGLYNVHPFRVSERLVFAHNGMLDVEKDKKKSDTQVFNETILRKLKPNFLNNSAVCSLIEGFIGSDKLVFLNNDGKSVILNEQNGHWKAGVWYSNKSYKSYKTTSYGWGSDYCGYGYSAKPYKQSAVTTYKGGGVAAVTGNCGWCYEWGEISKEITPEKATVYLCKTCKPYNK